MKILNLCTILGLICASVLAAPSPHQAHHTKSHALKMIYPKNLQDDHRRLSESVKLTVAEIKDNLKVAITDLKTELGTEASMLTENLATVFIHQEKVVEKIVYNLLASVITVHPLERPERILEAVSDLENLAVETVQQIEDTANEFEGQNSTKLQEILKKLVTKVENCFQRLIDLIRELLESSLNIAQILVQLKSTIREIDEAIETTQNEVEEMLTATVPEVSVQLGRIAENCVRRGEKFFDVAVEEAKTVGSVEEIRVIVERAASNFQGVVEQTIEQALVIFKENAQNFVPNAKEILRTLQVNVEQVVDKLFDLIKT